MPIIFFIILVDYINLYNSQDYGYISICDINKEYKIQNVLHPCQKTNITTNSKSLLYSDYFYNKDRKSDATDFEPFAIAITTLADTNIISCDNTRPSRDGGRDGIGEYRIMNGLNQALKTVFAVEAKCYDLNNSVGVKETSRLISRIRHRQFGVFVTTSYVDIQAYKEIIEDEDNLFLPIFSFEIISLIFIKNSEIISFEQFGSLFIF